MGGAGSQPTKGRAALRQHIDILSSLHRPQKFRVTPLANTSSGIRIGSDWCIAKGYFSNSIQTAHAELETQHELSNETNS